jgi:hypothetical protein
MHIRCESLCLEEVARNRGLRGLSPK